MIIDKFKDNKRRLILLLFDILCYLGVSILNLLLTRLFDNSPNHAIWRYVVNAAINFVTLFVCRILMKCYYQLWRYISTKALFSLVVADFCGGIGAALLSYLISVATPLKIYEGIWQFLTVSSLCALLALFSRFAYRLIYKEMNARAASANVPKETVAIVGAGQLGAYLANELLGNPDSQYRPACFIDNKKEKIGNIVCGLRVYGEEQIDLAIENYGVTLFVVAISNLDAEKMNEFYEFYSKKGCRVRLYAAPAFGQDDGNQKLVIRDFEIEDLLFRKPLDITTQAAAGYYREKTVLVTGGGGSIGSELCRQISKCSPKRLVIFDIYENNAYDIQQELSRKYGDTLDLAVEIGSVRDRARLDSVFAKYRPEIVFHAAAHKHVPLMEMSSSEAIKNNVLGTYNTADMAEKYGAKKFILISTDKAVNPTNVMGASKRLCEMVIQCRTDSGTSFAAVRFGNVLGSNGSVIPLFKRQILAGGPVTVTDKRIIRYFMTIPEASQLVMHAGALAQKGQLFVLDMGKPVRIYDLAVNMIKLMGLEPEKDIEIKEIGLRPGEKLYEELLMKNEALEKTDNEMIFVERDTPYTRAEVDEKLQILSDAAKRADEVSDQSLVKEAIRRTVPTFHDPEEVNKTAGDTKEMQLAGVRL